VLTTSAQTGTAQTAALSPADRELLLHLLELPTAGPLETGGTEPVRLWEAQWAYAEAAAHIGMMTVRHAAAEPTEVTGDHIPQVVRRLVAEDPDFLAAQPSLVLRLGPELPVADTVMFNVHLDTVAGRQPVSFDGERFHGRGAIDAKGPAVALLAGIRAAMAEEPALGREVGVVVQAVAGEEGGAMGVFGTRPLVERGHVGRLNVFCEPTRLRLLTRSTAAMTACLTVGGHDAIDDDPGAGHNATVLLGYLAQHLAATLPQQAADGQVCVAGLETGPMHNKVYGTGRLLLNLSYGSAASGRALEEAMRREVDAGLARFAELFRGNRALARTAAEAAAVTRLEWLKRGLPALAAADPWAERLLTRDAGLDPWPAEEPAFTCDAIWMDGVPGTFTAVYGPGDLGANNAHAENEFADAAELERFADGIRRILTTFARSRRTARSGPAQHDTAHHGTAHHGTARHESAQHNTAQHDAAHRKTVHHQPKGQHR
jgi:acetylornithine deacetylase/succinyl-diaminopimelate desuccinylase-like protein